ncbi:IS110 family transposase [Azospirillum sp. RWY-5-1]|uniref:IS110 family transposase n=1 Tax=Azospirillum oleiclasticum TaxID=2735135 RepID=A0ABX2TGQ6_9PROT|nr:IS110 family transposase [Azospirillum oleiclasticum]NYZ14416.1 IS110 family transposase [Azospirillum oleiclasticum]NYZ23232.1 IS110 family transposase [Azospirillum oleiclasticum]
MQQPEIGRSTATIVPEEILVVVIEMSLSSWLVAGLVPGVDRRPLKTLSPDENALLLLLEGWRREAIAAGRDVTRMVVAYEAGRDGYWLARWLRARGIEARIIHASSVAVSRDRRRAKTDRLDTELLMRVLLGWLRGEPGHCTMVAVPGIEEEDAKRPTRERENLVGERTRIINRMKAAFARLGIRDVNPALRKTAERLDGLRTPEGVTIPANAMSELRRDTARLRMVEEQIAEIERERMERMAQAAPQRGHADAMVRMLSRVVGIGVETADLLVQEILLRDLRDRRAVARYAGLTGSPDESGARRRERGLSRAGNARVRKGMVQLAWRFLVFQKESALVKWFRERTADGRGRTRMVLIVALARKLLIALWRMVKTGEVPQGTLVRPDPAAA